MIKYLSLIPALIMIILFIASIYKSGKREDWEDAYGLTLFLIVCIISIFLPLLAFGVVKL